MFHYTLMAKTSKILGMPNFSHDVLNLNHCATALYRRWLTSSENRRENERRGRAHYIITITEHKVSCVVSKSLQN